jgi:hypothetical protein
MDDKTMIVVRAFGGLDKEATGASCSVPPQFRSKMDNKANKEKRKKADKPIGRATAIKYGWKPPKGKKAAITKESLAGNSEPDVIEVEVERIEKAAVTSALDIIEKLAADGLDAAQNPFMRRPSGVTNAQVSQVGVLRSKAKAEKRKQQQISDIGDTLNPEPNEAIKSAIVDPLQSAYMPTRQRVGEGPLGGLGGIVSSLGGLFKGKKPAPGTAVGSVPAETQPNMLQRLGKAISGFKTPVLHAKGAAVKEAQGAQGAGPPDPYAAFEQMTQDGNTVSKAIPGLDPSVVLQGQQMGVDMTPGGIKKRLGAHDMIAKGKKILKDENQNGVPDVAEGAAGMGGQQQLALGGQPQQPQAQPQPQAAPMVAAAKLRTPDLTKKAKKWIAKAIKHPGALHKQLGVPEGEKIPAGKLEAAADKGGKLGERARLAETLKGMGKKGGQPDLLSKLSMKQDTKGKKKEEETKPGVVKLESASDTPPKKAPEKKPEAESENEAEKKEAAIAPALAGLGMRGAGFLSRLGAAPIRLGGKGIEAIGKKLHQYGPLARLGSTIEAAGSKAKEFGRFGRLTGKLMRRLGKGVQKGKYPFGGTPESGSMRFMKEVPILPGAARVGGKTIMTPKTPTSLGRRVYALGDEPKELVGKSLRENLASVAQKFGIGTKGGDLSAREVLTLMGPTGLGAGMAVGGAKLLGGGEKKEEKKEEKKAAMGAGAVPLKTDHGLPKRDGFKTTNRQGVFNDLSRWSLGARM